MRINLLSAVGKGCPNRPEDVRAIAQTLTNIGKLPKTKATGLPDEAFVQAIINLQRIWTPVPDGVISVHGATHKFLEGWKIKPIATGVQLPGRLREAWDLVNPLLPEGSYCSSGYRSADDQRRILHDFFLTKHRRKIVAKYGLPAYETVKLDLLGNEVKVLSMVKGVGQDIAAPGKSAHQRGKAIDVSGGLAAQQVQVIKMVARANPGLLSGKVISEINRCVHFEIF
jgi:hypothetical protein